MTGIVVGTLVSSSIGSIFCNVLSNTIFEIGKHILGSRNSDKMNIKEIKKKISQNIDEELLGLWESGVLRSYLEEPQTIDMLYDVIELKIAKQIEKLFFRKNVKKVDGFQEEKDIFEFLINNLIKTYRTETVVEVPDKKILYKCFKFICDEVVEYVYSILDTSEKIELYTTTIQWRNSHMLFNNGINSILQQLKDMQKYPIIYNENDFSEIKGKYYNILKEKNSMAHIYLLDTYKFDTFYVPPVLELETEVYVRGIESKRIIRRPVRTMYTEEDGALFEDWKHIFDRKNIVYVTGGAGYGKTLFMKKIINNYEKLNVFQAEKYLVIYGELKMFFLNDKETPLSMIEFLQTSIKNSTLLGEKDVSQEVIQYFLEKGRCIILLDALDEVDKSKRAVIHDTIISYFKTQNPSNKVCITSRSRGFFPYKDLENYNIRALTPMQIEEYVDNIISFGKFDKRDKIPFMQQADLLVKKNFLNSFLVLSLLISIYKAERELPENKLELYQKCFEYIATKREKEKSSSKYCWEDIGLLMKDNTFIELSNLCYPNNMDVDTDEIKNKLVRIYTPKFGTEAKAENVIDEFLAFCSDRTELFVPSTEDHFKFFHRSFFEYFYSQFIFTRCNSAMEIYERLSGFDVDSEIFELTVATLKQKSELRYQELLELMFKKVELEFDSTAKTYTAFNILTLSMQVVDDKLYKDRFVQIILDKKQALLQDIFSVNNSVIADFIISTDSYIQAIDESYYFENMSIIVVLLKEWYKIYKKQKSKGEDSRILIELIPKIAFPPGYNIKIFSSQKKFEDVIDALNDKTLQEIRMNTSLTNREWYGVKSSINAIKELPVEEQKNIIKNLIALISVY